LTLVTFSPPASATPSVPVHWQQADNNVFVATSGGEYAGFVSHAAEGFDAHGALGEDLGSHASAGMAMLVVEDARGSDSSRTPRSSRRFRLTRPLRTRRRGTHGR
jgi:hypothetical protein